MRFFRAGPTHLWSIQGRSRCNSIWAQNTPWSFLHHKAHFGSHAIEIGRSRISSSIWTTSLPAPHYFCIQGRSRCNFTLPKRCRAVCWTKRKLIIAKDCSLNRSILLIWGKTAIILAIQHFLCIQWRSRCNFKIPKRCMVVGWTTKYLIKAKDCNLKHVISLFWGTRVILGGKPPLSHSVNVKM